MLQPLARPACLAVVVAALAVPAVALAATPVASPTQASAIPQEEVELARSAFIAVMSELGQGAELTDDQIKSRPLGRLQPLTLACAATHRELRGIAARYLARRQELSLAQLMSASRLATRADRDAARAQIALAQEALEQYVADNVLALRRAKTSLDAAYAATPTDFGVPRQAVTTPPGRIRLHFLNFFPLEQRRQSTALAIVQLLDEHPDTFQLSQDTPPRLEFRDQAVLGQYRVLAGRMNAQNQAIEDLNLILTAPSDQIQRALEELDQPDPAK